jgi:hypothetical protein
MNTKNHKAIVSEKCQTIIAIKRSKKKVTGVANRAIKAYHPHQLQQSAFL